MAMQLTLTINQFAKTQEGMALIAEQKPFILNGLIYQGYEGALASCSEKQLTLEEIDAAPDIDGSRDRIYAARKDRVDGRVERTMVEYRKRRADLREQRNTIRDSMEKDAKMGLPPSPADRQDIAELDKRMERITVLTTEVGDASAVIPVAPDTVLPVATAPEPGPPPPDAEPDPAASLDPDKVIADVQEALKTPTECDLCGKVSPPGHSNPAKWKHAHKMGAHKNPRKKD